MEEQKVNKKLLIVCGVLLLIGVIFFLSPIGKGTPTTPNQEVNNGPQVTQEVVNNIINSPENPTIDIPNLPQVDSLDLSKYSNTSYALSTSEVMNSKKSGLYNTYSDNVDYVANPYYQKYSFSKESGEKDVDIKDYPKSYYGSLATQNDYNSKFPNGTSSSTTTDKEENKEEDKEDTKDDSEKPKENQSSNN